MAEQPSAMLYFNSFETREAAFCQSIFNLIPCKYNGPRRFWEDFSRIAQQGLALPSASASAYITSNPRDCLAFGSAQQVLSAVRMRALRAGGKLPPSIDAIAEDFGLGAQLSQPIRTLSGGETVKLALAKALLSTGFCRTLSIASPFCWLSQRNMVHLDRVVARYRQAGADVALFALCGEDSREPAPLTLTGCLGSTDVDFAIQLKQARIPLGTVVHTITGVPAWAGVDDFETALKSPCLLKGENGQGKSLVARALCGALRAEGTAAVTGPAGSGKARLLFQDIITQTLLRSFQAIARSGPSRQETDAGWVYEEIRRFFKCFAGADDLARPWDVRQFSKSPPSLLEIKMVLAAVRLCGRPCALILDEPDWGLTRVTALALVAALIRVAHGLKVPIVLISHKPWWQPLARSALRVAKAVDHQAPDSGQRFRILLQPEFV
jgi:ABC-type Mn2+/Zn2+ transport system ATPase subunit